MPEWVDGTCRQLARSSRPGYPGRLVGTEVVDDWISIVLNMGVRSIICLLTADQLEYYREVPGGLLHCYRASGTEVRHRPITDPAHNPRGWDELDDAMPQLKRDLEDMPKPVLVHCSAGIDRTGRVVDRYLLNVTREQWEEWAAAGRAP